MHIGLLTPTPPDVSSLGVRSISSYLKAQGHRVSLYLLPGGVEETRFKPGYVYYYPDKILGELAARLEEVDLIGISFMTNYFDRAVQLTRVLEKLHKPLIWGGVHPTVCPEEAIQYVDYVCIGEGEKALLEFVRRIETGKSLHTTPNFWVRHNGGIEKNDPFPLIEDLDELPFPDYSCDSQFSVDLRNMKIVPQDDSFLEKTFPVRPNMHGGFDKGYVIMTERGCPFSCTYCINNQLRNMAGNQKYLRRRSIHGVLQELKTIIAQFPFVKTIIFFDDTLAARPLQELQEFAERYPVEIGLPFHGQVSPTTISAEKWELLLQAGMIFVEMGIQSANTRIQQMYNRRGSNERVREAVSLIHSTQRLQLAPCYHVILDNPWEAPEELLETLHFVLELPRPFWLKRASLVLFPGTALFERAKLQGLITDEHAEIYRKHLHTPLGNYLNVLFYLCDRQLIPTGFIKILAHPRLVKLLHKPGNHRFYTLLIRFIDWCELGVKGIESLMRGDFARIRRFLARVR